MKMSRELYSSGGPFEDIAMYSRAVKVGNHIFVAGSTSSDKDGNIIGKQDHYAQTVQTLVNIENALKQAGASMADVVRTRMFVTDISQWEAYGKGHAKFFTGIKPAATMVEVQRLIHPDMLIEIEADAVIAD
jgi:enamine deaminase RidA (YjgF/YER057c/UK114 family)